MERRENPESEERRRYLKTVGALVAGLAIGGAVAWLGKPAERVIESVTETVLGPTVTKTVTVPITPTPTPTPTPPPEIWWKKVTEPYRGTKLVMVGEELAPLEALAEIAPEFEEETGISVEIEFLAEEVVFEKTMMDMISGAGIYSMIQGVHYNFGKFVEPGYLRPIDDLLKSELAFPELDQDDFMQRPWKMTCLYDPDTGKYGEGNCYGLLFTTHCMFVWYRKDLFTHPDEQTAFKAKYGYDIPVDGPKTWKQYYDLAEFFTRRKGETLGGKFWTMTSLGRFYRQRSIPLYGMSG